MKFCFLSLSNTGATVHSLVYLVSSVVRMQQLLSLNIPGTARFLPRPNNRDAHDFMKAPRVIEYKRFILIQTVDNFIRVEIRERIRVGLADRLGINLLF